LKGVGETSCKIKSPLRFPKAPWEILWAGRAHFRGAAAVRIFRCAREKVPVDFAAAQRLRARKTRRLLAPRFSQHNPRNNNHVDEELADREEAA
jgi:hypothetical protein